MIVIDSARAAASPGEGRTVMKSASEKYKSLSAEELQVRTPQGYFLACLTYSRI